MLVWKYEIFAYWICRCQGRVRRNVPLVVFVPGINLPKDNTVWARVVGDTFALVNCLLLLSIDAFKLCSTSGDPLLALLGSCA